MSVEVQDGIDTEGTGKPEYLQAKSTPAVLLPVNDSGGEPGCKELWTQSGEHLTCVLELFRNQPLSLICNVVSVLIFFKPGKPDFTLLGNQLIMLSKSG